ncbi:arylesterase [Gemmatimonas groenlandica]|uniref:Arylesterase n=1 Tax=Gemmatimonas groenlandica TaxID=2732249 RepID=A0A6M4IHT6_9BACT|nr:arylesterase [Gemmatimonas groenlandica]QJR34664.1 arylesterase [Gemmatimonas groenlandica]
MATRSARVVLLGTSLTAGLGLDPEKAYPALLQQKADSAGYAVRIVNAGLSGETSAGALRRAGWVLDQPAALVVLEVGANDGLRGVDPDSTYANIVALVKVVRTQRPEADVALVQMEAPTNLGGSYTTRFHEAYPRAAKVTGVTLLPFLLEGVAGDARLNQADGIHPNPEGSKRVAETVWRGLSPLLAKVSRR